MVAQAWGERHLYRIHNYICITIIFALGHPFSYDPHKGVVYGVTSNKPARHGDETGETYCSATGGLYQFCIKHRFTIYSLYALTMIMGKSQVIKKNLQIRDLQKHTASLISFWHQRPFRHYSNSYNATSYYHNGNHTRHLQQELWNTISSIHN